MLVIALVLQVETTRLSTSTGSLSITLVMVGRDSYRDSRLARLELELSFGHSWFGDGVARDSRPPKFSRQLFPALRILYLSFQLTN